MSDRYDAFISYSRADFDEVRTFVGRLASAVPGFRYWMDLEGIESGDQFIEKIVVAIDRSEHLLFMISENSLKSPWTKKEVMYASNTGKRIVPVILKGARLSGWYLFQFGNTDTIDTQDERQVQKLIRNLRDWCTSSGEVPAEEPVEEVELYSIGHNDRWGFCDRNDNIVIPLVYDATVNFAEGLGGVRKDGKCGFVDKSGNVVIPLIYDSAMSFTEGRARVKKDGRCGYIDRKGKVVIHFIYDVAWFFAEGLAAVRKDGKWGFIDRNGRTVIPFIYDEATFFTEGLAVVRKGNKWGYIDRNGAVVIPFCYDWADRFDEGRASVNRDGKWGYIDRNGNWTSSCSTSESTSSHPQW